MRVSNEEIAAGYVINKFGRNPVVSVPADIWNSGGYYTGFPDTADTFSTVSTSALDTAGGTGAQVHRWYYLDDDLNMFDDEGEPLFFDVVLNGLTPVVSEITGKRIWSGRTVQAGSSRKPAGSVSVHHTATPTTIFATTPISGQSTLSNFTIPKGYTGFLLRLAVSMLDKTANRANMVIFERKNGVDVETYHHNISTTLAWSGSPFRGLVLEEETDFVFRCIDIGSASGDIVVHYDISLVRNY